MTNVVVVDYGAGNVRSVLNALEYIGVQDFQLATTPQDIENATKVILPGVGHFSHAVDELRKRGLWTPLQNHIGQKKPFLGICIGLHLLCSDSKEAEGYRGLGILENVTVEKIPTRAAIPHIGWNVISEVDPQLSSNITQDSDAAAQSCNESFDWSWSRGCADLGRMYFAHSFCIPISYVSQLQKDGWTVLETPYADARFISGVKRGLLVATQFHLEKSGEAGLEILQSFVNNARPRMLNNKSNKYSTTSTSLAKRIIACLDVRRNDKGRLIVTKGTQYKVREDVDQREVRDLGDPVELAEYYYKQGADEIVFLSIKSFNTDASADEDLLDVVRRTAKRVFVPLCVGGGIRNGPDVSALSVAAAYFNAGNALVVILRHCKIFADLAKKVMAGADKMAITSDAVAAAEAWMASGGVLTGTSSLEEIAARFGRQAVVLSVDAKTVQSAGKTEYYATSRGGRVLHDLKVVDLIRACEQLGAGEILVNSVDKDGTNSGFDIALVQAVKNNTRLPVIASSGAGTVDDFQKVFALTNVEAALAAGIFHRKEVAIKDLKLHLAKAHLPCRLVMCGTPLDNIY